MRIEGGSRGGDNLEILGGDNQSFLTLRGGTIFFAMGGRDPNTCLQGGVCPPLSPLNLTYADVAKVHHYVQ